VFGGGRSVSVDGGVLPAEAAASFRSCPSCLSACLPACLMWWCACVRFDSVCLVDSIRD
jgi:hypothetical protein